MTTSIMVDSFMRDVYQVISSSFSKNQIESEVDRLFREFCIKSEKFSNKDVLISEVTEYKSEILKSLDQIIQFSQTPQSIPIGKEKV
ncbi:MAG: hypothetical protein KDK56_06810 [Simkania sp.]|nr:hypothetical protein [Simkania sp.]